MTSTNKATATPSVLAIGTVVVHNYGEFTHGVIVGYSDNAYKVFFSPDCSPLTPKYQANTKEAIAARIRTITLGKGFFVSRFNTIEDVRQAQLDYKKSGIALETAI